MLLDITHSTHFRFDGTVHSATQYIRLTPSSTATQRVLSWSLQSPEPTHGWTDGHGNRVESLTLHGGVREIELVAAGQVETIETAGVLGFDPPGALPPDYWLRAGPFTQPDASLTDLAARLVPRRPPLRLELLHELMQGITRNFPYRTGATDVGTTASQMVAIGAGVCQDHAQLFCTLARIFMVPARYISGYLLSGPISGAQDVSHAWAEAYVPGLGWVAFDPSNGMCATDHYIRVAVGVDYADGCPVRGVRFGGGDEKLTVSVAIAPVAAPALPPYNAEQQQ